MQNQGQIKMNRKFYFKILLNLFDYKISHWMSGITMLNKIIFNKTDL